MSGEVGVNGASAVGAVAVESAFGNGAAIPKGQKVLPVVLDQLEAIAHAIFRAAQKAPGISGQSSVQSLMGQNFKERNTHGFRIMEHPINVS